MSILIQGVKMPKRCEECAVAYHDDYGYYYCLFTHSIGKSHHRPKDCPLIEVPAHGRLIDADELYERAKMRSERFNGCFNDLDNVINALYIETFPTIIPAERGEESDRN